MSKEKVNNAPECNISKRDELFHQFLLAEQEFAIDERWKYYLHSWELFKFYVTMVTGSVGLILALFSVRLEVQFRYISLSVISVLLFVIGISIFIQLIHVDKGFNRANRRLILVRNHITKIIPLGDYSSGLIAEDAHYVTPYQLQPDYSISGQFKRAIRFSGIKTQLVAINCVLFLTTLISLFLFQGLPQIFIFPLILSGLLLSGFCHLLIAKKISCIP